MDQTTQSIMRECTEASDQERITFSQVVGKLMQAGVERYHADLLRDEKTFYMPDGAWAAVPCAPLPAVPAMAFAPEGVEAAVRAIQAGAIQYREFCRRIAAAGCVGYLVSLAGRCAVYYGRDGNSYREPFPAR
jgi:uncharacterized protein YbcV (DUF1398 family)